MRDQILIGGSWTDGADGERISVLDPATGEELTTVAAGTPADATAAVDAAAAAQAGWAATAPRERAEILRACWATLVDHTDELGKELLAHKLLDPVMHLSLRVLTQQPVRAQLIMIAFK